MIWRLFEDFSDEDCRRAMDESLRYNCFSYAFLKGFLSSSAKVVVDLRSCLSLREFSSSGVAVRRGLREYRL